jgi:endogenous inhibitor of DNA gyrase (YacG/DUF329 family)
MDPLDPLRDVFDVNCPVCGETFDVRLDMMSSEDELLEECPRCGAAVDLVIRKDDDGNIVSIDAARDQA